MAQTKTISLSPSTTIHTTISGPPATTTTNSHPTLIFLHFWGGSSRTFTSLTNLLSPSFPCISIAFPGWGGSTGPADASAYTIKSLATTIETLIPRLDIQDQGFILIGHSMGGKVAQLIAGRHQVKGLKGVVLLAPAPPTPLVLSPDMKVQQLSAYETPESAEFVVRNILSSSKLSDEVVGILVEDMVRGSEVAKKAWPGYGMDEDISEDARKIDVPVLVVVGDEDRAETVERVEREVLGNIKGVEMVVLEGKGHLLPVEAPEEVAGLARGFVGRVVG